jgi:hypothetical protein
MAGLADIKQRGRSWLLSGALIIVGVLVGQALPRSNAATSTQTGIATSIAPSHDGSAVTFVFKYKGNKHTYVLGDRTPWQDAPGVWNHSGLPSCMKSKAFAPRQITIGVINVQSSGTLTGGPLVVWIKCQG